MNLFRRGNALVLAFGVTAMIGTLVVISATSSTQVVQHNNQRMLQLRCVAAVEAVLQRREAAVIQMATDGSLLTWTGLAGEPGNFGEDIVGGCRVRWRIEPMRTLTAGEAPGNPAALEYIANPHPDPTATQNDADEVQNTVTYLYRIAAEAAFVGAPDPNRDNLRPVLARAQGARAVSAVNQPLFRYVIFYAAEGPKGDLELSHGPALDITGSVYSNGSIYMGSNVSADDWLSLNGGSGATTIRGVTAGSVARVTGIDGIYRMSKPLMVAYYNNLPINNGSGIASVTNTQYDLVTPLHPNEDAPPNLTTFATATASGTRINPRRVRSATNLVPGGSEARTINGIELTSDADGNDSRDLERTADKSWSNASSSIFQRRAQSADTGALAERIDPSISGAQALEAQQLTRVDTDGDPTTDEHAAYLPQFFDATGTVTTTALPAGQPVEVPGTYMSFALGGGLAMQRRADGAGWTITTPTGGAAGAVTQSALIIRERPIPDVNIWPGAATTMQPIPPNDPGYLPYAYGKHWRPSILPVVPIDITENLHGQGTNDAWGGIATVGDTPYGLRTASDGAIRSISYANDQLDITAATQVPGDSYEAMTYVLDNPGQSYLRRHQYARSNGRMAHVKKRHGLTDTQILALPQGLRAWVWTDNHQGVSGIGGGDMRVNRLLGVPTWSGIDVQVNGAAPFSPNAAGNPAAPGGFSWEYFSVRWDGYLIPPAQGQYTLQLNCDDGVRVWVDDQLVYERWSYISGNQPSDPIQLSANRPARIVIDFYEHAGGEGMTLSWTKPDGTTEIVPAANLRAAPAVPGFDREDFSAITAKVSLAQLRANPAAIAATQKAGLMLREGFGSANMLNGRDRYVFLGINPSRGIFAERRMQPSIEQMVSNTVTDYWVDQGASQTVVGPGPWIAAGGSGSLGVPTDRSNATYNVQRTSTMEYGGNNPLSVQRNIQYFNDSTSSTTTTHSPSTAGSIALDESTSISGLRYGGWFKERTRSVQARERWRKRTDWYMDFTTYRGAYPPNPYNPGDRPRIYFFNDSSTTTTTSVEWNWNGGYDVGTKTYADGPGPRLIRQTQGAWASGNDSGTKTNTATTGSTSSRAIWRPSGGWPPGWTGAQVVARLNDLNWNGRSDWILGSGSGNPPGDPGPSRPSFTYAELDDPTATLADPSNPIPDSNEHSFSVALTNTFTLRLDNNPFISRSGEWGSAYIDQTRPWLDTWTSGFGLNPVQTRSFRPDLWYSAVTLPPSALHIVQTESANAPQGGYPAALPHFDDVIPAWWATSDEVWLRIEHNTTTGDLALRFANGSDPDDPGTAGNPWVSLAMGSAVSLGAPDANTTYADEDVWNRSLLIGPYVESGSVGTAMTTAFSEIVVNTSENIGNNDGVWDRADWEQSTLPGNSSPTSRYLASQYQVFYGNQDISQDFFSYADQVGGDPLAIEDWFYQTREFWSQNPAWSSGVLKDLVSGVPTNTSTVNRQLFAKTTVLRLNLGRIFEYMRSRDLTQATTLVMDGTASPAFVGPDLTSMFNGLIYAVRTNRYPVNPFMEAAPTTNALNPWSTASDTVLVLPNQTTTDRYADLETSVAAQMFHNGVHKLQPYGLPDAPPMRPQEFHHGVMLENAADFNWETFAGGEQLGTGGTTIATPNHLYLRGDFNTATKNVAVPNAGVQARPVPVAVMGDTITLLSNAFNLEDYQVPGFYSTNSGFSGPSILAQSRGRPAADTSYTAAIVTYNQPSTLDRVRERQAAAVIDTMQYLENWLGRTMTYQGSLVVLGTKRYTESFLLNVPKVSGRSAFNPPAPAAGSWTGLAMQVYSAPERVMNYNTDLLTPQGTPPFTPNGVTTASLGGWVRVVQ